MANEIAVQKNATFQPAPRRALRDWDASRVMRDLLRWDPFAEMTPAWADIVETRFAPDFDVKEKKGEFLFTADVPGVGEKDLQIQLAGNRLSISGKRESEKTEQNETYYASERSHGSFTRVFTLPEGVELDKVRAELKDGVLRVTVPKRPEAQARIIDVAAK